MRSPLAWQLLARILRLAAIGCFLHAFGLPAGSAVVVTVSVVYGSDSAPPLPGAGTAAAAGALLVALPLDAGHAVAPLRSPRSCSCSPRC